MHLRWVVGFKIADHLCLLICKDSCNFKVYFSIEMLHVYISVTKLSSQHIGLIVRMASGQQQKFYVSICNLDQHL